MAHNYKLTGNARKRCPECGKKANTISSPNNAYTRTADYQIECCNRIWCIKIH